MKPAVFNDPDLLPRLVAERDASCPRCGYNLRGITSSACPECSARLDVRIGSADLRIGAWIASVIVLAIALGFVGSVTGIGTYATLLIVGPPSPREVQSLVASGGITVVLAAGIVVLVRWRRRFLRAPSGHQRVAAVLVTLLAGCSVWTFIWLMSRL